MTDHFITTLESIPIVLFRQDRSLKYLWVWDNTGSFGGKLLTGCRDEDVFSETNSERLRTFKEAAFLTGAPQQLSLELETDEDVRYFQFSIRPIIDGAGKVIEISGSGIDISEPTRREVELKKAVDTAETASLAKSAFLATMSHEIRTPLTAVMGFASILSKELKGEHKEFAQLIEYSGKRLLDMLGLVLTLAKLDSGGPDVRLDELDLSAEVASIVQLLQPMAADKYLELTFQSTEEARNVRAHLDRGALNSIMYNLIGNAIKYTDEGGIDVRVEINGQKVIIVVGDTGQGMDPAFIPHLFDPFSQEQSHRPQVDGVGLGMSITKRLVEMMKGSIQVESDRGSGTRFLISFPFVEGKKSRTEEVLVVEPAPTYSEGEKFVLLVEDNPDTSFLMKHVLQDFYHVELASNAEEALLEARLKQFDLVLMDINLGGEKSGMEVMQELRTYPRHEHVPIIAITAYALPGDRERFLGSGFDAYLPKPFAVDDLLETIADFLSR